ncbi:Short-chain dehydrogenase [Geosmithia morbida]|uniref:Short-chain dehydrogenase n=1 Tax=Geosmithia morbida TaxID=1094350 RepID=A0A9P4YTP8_9HYPO|nr:Short-chain dehydrogenase [Geosmithia morbida]KAF4121481.1 Short-chain dehydrogenase [Geosmithia morbida]
MPLPRTAIVTGSARGIGKAIAHRLASDGFKVTISDLPSMKAEAEATASQIAEATGSETHVALGDVSRRSDVQDVVDSHVSSLGPLYAMVANAGICQVNPAVEVGEEEFRRTFDVNVGGVFNSYQVAGKQMIQQGTEGRLIGCASIVGFKPFPLLTPYSASKFAVRGLTQGMAMEMAPHGIRVNCFCPGIHATAMWDYIDHHLGRLNSLPKGGTIQKFTDEYIALKRTGQPEDVAKLIAIIDTLIATLHSLILPLQPRARILSCKTSPWMAQATAANPRVVDRISLLCTDVELRFYSVIGVSPNTYTMAKSKASKRKRVAQTEQPRKIPKNALSSPPPDGSASDTPVEPKNLGTVVPDEELEITIDTLKTLSQYPSLIKTRQCRDVRAAVYDFRQSCTTGTNSVDGGAGTNLTGRITGALADGKFTDARILLSEMRIRGEEPKLGALCRWVRDLDFISGLSTQHRVTQDGELISVLDSVLRVSCPIDANPTAVVNPSSPIAPQPIWDLGPGPGVAREQVYASVLDKTILDAAPASLRDSLRVVERTEGGDRRPPNQYPAIVYTTTPDAVTLAAEPPSSTFHEHPHVPGLGLAKNVLTHDECRAIIAAGESVEFIPDSPLRQDGETSILAHNFYWVVDTAFHDKLWSRVSSLVPGEVGGRLARGLNRRFRVYRYVPGAEYRCHIDGAWPPSGIRPDGAYVYDDSPADRKQSSLFTFLIYLNDEFEGGETTFFLPGVREGSLNAYPVRPVMGSVAVFPHGDSKGALLHEGTGVRKGAKYVIRTDVEYDVEPSIRES